MAILPEFQWPSSSHDVSQYLKPSSRYLGTFLWYCASGILIYQCIICFCLFIRFLRVKFGSRIEPDRRKAILITGATAGIGLALTKHFYKLGFSVIACYFNDQEPGYIELIEFGNKPYESVAKIRRKKKTKQGSSVQAPRLFLVRMDVRSGESIANSAQEIQALLANNDIELHCLINNAGISRDGPFEWCVRDSLKDVIDTNLTGVMMVTREFILNLITNKGRVVNVSSGVFLTPGPSISAYGSTKSAIAYFSASLNRDIARYGASSVCVMPGNFITTSSIIYPRIRCFQESERKLSDREKSVYRKSIEEYGIVMYNFLREKLENSGDNPTQVASMFKFDLPDFTPLKDHRPGCFASLIKRCFKLLDGSVAAGKTLEQSGILEGYENAVCLKKPSQAIYAGSSLYTYFTGPYMEYMPRVAYDLMTRMSAIGLGLK